MGGGPSCWSGMVTEIANVVQLVMSSATADPYFPTGQFAHTVAVEDAMKVPGEQHPKRAVLVPNWANAAYVVNDSHAPPQSDRVKPLL